PALGTRARQVLSNASARDRRHPPDAAAGQQRRARREVRAMRAQQLLADRGAELIDVTVDTEPEDVERDPPRQRIAVRVQARRRQGDELIAGFAPAAIDDG